MRLNDLLRQKEDDNAGLRQQ